MIIDSSLARGLRQREHRRLVTILNKPPSIQGRGTRAAWLRRAHSRIMGIFDKYVVCNYEEGTKPANTVKKYMVMVPTTEDEYISYNVMLIEIKGKDQSHDLKESPIGITHHAYERVIQSIGSTKVREAAEILHSPVLSMIFHISKKRDTQPGRRIKDL